MTTLQDRIREDVKAALKAGRKEDLEVLRMLLADAQKLLVDAGAPGNDCDDATMLKVLQRAAKTRAESVEAFLKGGRADLADREQAQIAIIRRYLPQAAGEDEIRAVVEAVLAESGASGKAAMGTVMKAVMARLGGRADGGTVSRLVGARLS